MSDIWKRIVKDLLTALYYDIPDCGYGGCAHIVTYDLNVSDSDIDFIVKYAKENSYAPEAPLVICLGEYLRRLTVDERRSVLHEWWDEYWRRVLK